MRIGLLQLNPVVGDITGNVRRMIETINTLDADIIVTPEMSICGYPPRDLLHCSGFVHGCEEAATQVGYACKDKMVLVSHPRMDAVSRRTRNSTSVFLHGEIIATCDKKLLPSYDVFDEKRYFESGDTSCVFSYASHTIGIVICEDFWRGLDTNAAPTYDFNPVDDLIKSGCDILISPSASPFVTNKHALHLQYALEVAKENNVTIAVCNQVGGNDDVVFDGGSFVVSPSGLLGELPLFDTGAISIDLHTKSCSPITLCEDEERFRALVLGTRDYFEKTGHKTALLGLSGGIDSALVAAIAVAALGSDSVTGVLMPSRYSSLGSVEDAEQLANNLGIETITLPIEHMHSAFERTLDESLLEATGIAGENVQARIRGLLLMGIANERGSLLLATGNKSELAVGYSTLYGDMSGAISVIGDIYKTDVWSMAKWINNNYVLCGYDSSPIPESSITKPPSAELRPAQLDQDSLPEYEELDSVLRLHIDFDLGVDDIEDTMGLSPELIARIVRMVDISQFKRDQAAVIFKTSTRTFGRGRRMPIVMKRNWVNSRETT